MTTTLNTVMTTNNAYDSILLVDGDKVVSQWRADERNVANYLSTGFDATDWEIHDAAGLGSIADFGEIAGQHGQISSDARRAYWTRMELPAAAISGQVIHEGDDCPNCGQADPIGEAVEGDCLNDSCNVHLYRL